MHICANPMDIENCPETLDDIPVTARTNEQQQQQRRVRERERERHFLTQPPASSEQRFIALPGSDRIKDSHATGLRLSKLYGASGN
jgi:hypothetical protein